MKTIILKIKITFIILTISIAYAFAQPTIIDVKIVSNQPVGIKLSEIAKDVETIKLELPKKYANLKYLRINKIVFINEKYIVSAGFKHNDKKKHRILIYNKNGKLFKIVSHKNSEDESSYTFNSLFFDSSSKELLGSYKYTLYPFNSEGKCKSHNYKLDRNKCPNGFIDVFAQQVWGLKTFNANFDTQEVSYRFSKVDITNSRCQSLFEFKRKMILPNLTHKTIGIHVTPRFSQVGNKFYCFVDGRKECYCIGSNRQIEKIYKFKHPATRLDKGCSSNQSRRFVIGNYIHFSYAYRGRKMFCLYNMDSKKVLNGEYSNVLYPTV